jgi:TatD DNase family protein
VHSKGNELAVFDSLNKHPVNKCILHWYSGTSDLLRQLASRGAYFTIGVEILFSDHIKKIAREVPLEQLLTETDNPLVKLSLPDALGLPRNIVDVVSELAAVKNTTVERMTDLIQENFQRISQDDPLLSRLLPQ